MNIKRRSILMLAGAPLMLGELCFGKNIDKTTRRLLKETLQEAQSFNDQYDAAVWLVDMNRRLSRYVKDPLERLNILTRAHHEATVNQLNPEIVLSVMHVESLFDRFALSTAGAQGLMQVMPFWKNEIGSKADNLMDVETNIFYGCRILKTYLKREKGNYTKALARYNGSVGKTWYPKRVFKALDKYWFVKHT